MTSRRNLSPAAALRIGLGLSASALVLWLITHYIAGAGALPRWRDVDPAWALGALFFCSLEIAVVAARWAFFARALAAPLGFRAALGAYYLSTLLNQLLPFGFLGDALRGLWHARRLAAEPGAVTPALSAATALILDRASGQGVLLLLLAPVLPLWWSPVRHAALLWAARASPFAVVLGLLIVALIAVLGRRLWRSAAVHTARARRVFLQPRGLAIHGAWSLSFVVLHALAFWCVARALGFAPPCGLLVRVVPVLLVAGTVPSFFAGTGVREAAAAGLYQLLGLRAADGALIALSLGLVGLLASLPGLAVLLLERRQRRGALPAID